MTGEGPNPPPLRSTKSVDELVFTRPTPMPDTNKPDPVVPITREHRTVPWSEFTEVVERTGLEVSDVCGRIGYSRNVSNHWRRSNAAPVVAVIAAGVLVPEPPRAKAVTVFQVMNPNGKISINQLETTGADMLFENVAGSIWRVTV